MDGAWFISTHTVKDWLKNGTNMFFFFFSELSFNLNIYEEEANYMELDLKE